jgi:hypothetical protein
MKKLKAFGTVHFCLARLTLKKFKRAATIYILKDPFPDPRRQKVIDPVGA